MIAGAAVAAAPRTPSAARPKATPPAPWPSRPRVYPRPDEAEVLAALELLYGDASGYAELGVIDGDPDSTKMRAPHDGQRWQKFTYTTPANRPALATLYCDLVERYGNVYWSLGLYAQRDRDERYLLPLRVAFLDDPVRTLDEIGAPALVLQTSPNSQQHFYALSAPCAAGDYHQLAMLMKAAAGAGKNSSNALHMVRGPGAVNTKAKYSAPFVARVKALAPDDTIKPAAVLRQLQGTAPNRERTPRAIGNVGTGDEPWRSREHRDALRRAADHVLPLVVKGRMLDSNGMPRGLQPHQQGYKILAARARGEITYTSEGGNWDASRERYHVGLSLAMIGYNRAELAALLLTLADFGVEVKGSDAIWLDVCRVIHLVIAELGDGYKPKRPEPLGDAPVVTLAAVSRAPRGRPAGQRVTNAARLAALLAPHVGQHVKRPALAAQLGVEVRMLAEYRRDLEAAHPGDVVIRNAGRGGWFIEKCAIKSAAESVQSLPAEEPIDRIPVRNTASDASQEYTPPPMPGSLPVCDAPGASAVPDAAEEPTGASPDTGGVCPPGSAPARPLLPRELVAEALDACPGAYGRAKFRAVLAYVRANGGQRLDEGAIRRLYDAERTGRQFAARDAALAATARSKGAEWRRRRLKQLARQMASDPRRALALGHQHRVIAEVHEAQLLAGLSADECLLQEVADVLASERPRRRRPASDPPLAPAPPPSPSAPAEPPRMARHQIDAAALVARWQPGEFPLDAIRRRLAAA